MQRVYRYKIFNKLGEIVKYFGLAVIVNTIIQGSNASLTESFKIIAAMTAILFLGRSFLRWIEHYQLDHHSIYINNLFSKNQAIPFNQINRIIVKDENHHIYGTQQKMTIMQKNGDKNRITISDLQDADAFMLALKNHSDQFSFVQQDVRGEIVS